MSASSGGSLGSKRKYVVLLFLFVSHYSSYALELNSNLLKKDTAVSVTKEKSVIFNKGKINLKYELPLVQLQKILSQQEYKLKSMQHEKEPENFQPKIYAEKEFTLFLRKVNFDTAVNLCKTIFLPMLTLTNFPLDYSFKEQVVLATKITVSSNDVVCTGPDLFFRNQECINYILANSKSRNFYKKGEELKNDLFNLYNERTVYLSANRTHFYFTIDGGTNIYGCAGKYAKDTNILLQRIHSQFYDQLENVILSLFSFIEENISNLIETIHAISYETYDEPIDISSNLIPRILELTPKFLPNIQSSKIMFPDFEMFFRTTVKFSSEILLKEIQNIETLSNMSLRSKQLLLKSLSQFKVELTLRLNSFIKLVNPSVSVEVPTDLLFQANQNPISFIYFMRNFMPELSEELLVQAFILIQNVKTYLLQDIAEILHKTLILPTISYRTYSESVKKNFNHINAQDLIVRNKRSWSSFWSSFWGSASEEEIGDIYKNEVHIKEAEMSVQNKMYNLTEHSRKFDKIFQNVATAVTTIEQKQGNLFRDLQNILSGEKTVLNTMRGLYIYADRISLLTSEYLSLLSSTMLIVHSVKQAEALVETSITGYLDFNQISTTSLRSLLPNNFLMSLKTVKAKIEFDSTGYTIAYEIPKYSETFQMYTLKQIPIFKDKNWFELSNLESVIIMNKVHDYLLYEEVVKYCFLQGTTYLCKNNELEIYKFNAKVTTCTLQIILNQNQASKDLTECKLQQIYNPAKQTSLIKNGTLYISSPLKNDTLHVSCLNKANYSESMNLGLNIFNFENKCNYETSELLISSPEDFTLINQQGNLNLELKLIQTLSSSDDLLLEPSLPTEELSDLFSLIDKFKQDVIPEGKAINVLKKQVENLDSSETLGNFSPLDFSLKTPHHVTNWLTALFWFAVITVFILIILCIQGIFPGCFCTGIKWLLRLIISFLRHFCCKKFQLHSRVHFQNTVQDESHALVIINPEASAPVAQEPYHQEARQKDIYPKLKGFQYKKAVEWIYSEGPMGDLQICCQAEVDNKVETLYFCPKENLISKSNNEILTGVQSPSKVIIENYFSKVNETPLPELCKDKEGCLSLQNFPLVKYINGAWYDQSTRKTLCGLRQPTF